MPLRSIAFFVLMLGLVGGRAYQELSRPQAWAYWKELVSFTQHDRVTR